MGETVTLLARLAEAVPRLGPAPLLTHVSLRQVAEQADCSHSSVVRTIRHKERLERLVLADSSGRLSRERREVDLWRAFETPPGAPLRERAGGIVACADELTRADRAVPTAATWAYLGLCPDVTTAQAEWFRAYHYVLSVVAARRFETLRARPAPPFVPHTFIAAAVALATGTVTLTQFGRGRLPADTSGVTVTEFLVAGTLPGRASPSDLPPPPPPPPAAPLEGRHVVEAAEALLAAGARPGPFGHLSARRITREVGISTGELYRSFADLDELRRRLLDHWLRRAERRLADTLCTSGSAIAAEAWLPDQAHFAVLCQAGTSHDEHAAAAVAEHLARCADLLGEAGNGLDAVATLGSAFGARLLALTAPDLAVGPPLRSPADVHRAVIDLLLVRR